MRGGGGAGAEQPEKLEEEGGGFPTVQEGGHSFGPVPLIVDFQPPERYKNGYALSEAA